MNSYRGIALSQRKGQRKLTHP